MSKADQETARRLAERYRAGPAEVSRRVKRAVIGGDWGANGYTTMAQADLLAREPPHAARHHGVRAGTLPHPYVGAHRALDDLYRNFSRCCTVCLTGGEFPIVFAQ